VANLITICGGSHGIGKGDLKGESVVLGSRQDGED
jgi:hypothetical protein